MNFRSAGIKRESFAFSAIGSILILIIGIILLFSTRWAQMGVWPYQYPKESLYLVDWLFPLIIIIIAIIIFIFKNFYNKLTSSIPINEFYAAFNIFIILGMTSGGIGMGIYGAMELDFIYYDSGPYLTWAKDQSPSDSITVCWHSNSFTSSVVNYGVSHDNLNLTAHSSENGLFHKVPIKGLESNTTYYYKIDRSSLNEVKEFTTAPLGTHDFSFAVWSDPSTNDGYESAINQANLPYYMAKDLSVQDKNFAFSICAGDITARGVDWRTWKLWLDNIVTDDFASNRSHVVSYGNHERHDDTGGINIPKYYPVYYSENQTFKDSSTSFIYGNVHFIQLDRWDYNAPWWDGVSDDYAEWLDEEIAEYPTAKFRILTMHPNPVYIDEHSGNNTAIMEVAISSGIDVIFCGHWHDYDTNYFNGSSVGIISGEKEISDGIVMMIGIGGNSEDANYGGYCQVDVTENSLTLRPRWIDGSWFDESFKITKV